VTKPLLRGCLHQ